MALMRLDDNAADDNVESEGMETDESFIGLLYQELSRADNCGDDSESGSGAQSSTVSISCGWFDL